MAGRSYNHRDKVPTVDTCRFVTAAYGVVVYDKKGTFVGKYATENEAVEAVRELSADLEE
ncbi:MAG: hypothetical protein ACI4EX_11870 [Lachnospiraceae bacterium]